MNGGSILVRWIALVMASLAMVTGELRASDDCPFPYSGLHLSSAEVALPKPPSSAPGGLVFSLIQKLERILEGSGSCAAKKEAIQGVFASFRPRSAESFLWAYWLSSHSDRIIRNWAIRRQIALAEMLSSLAPDDHDGWDSMSASDEEAMNAMTLKAVFLSLTSELSRLYGLKSLDGLARLDLTTQSRFARAFSEQLEGLLEGPAEMLLKRAQEFQSECDDRIAQLFGDANTIASGSGLERNGFSHGGPYPYLDYFAAWRRGEESGVGVIPSRNDRFQSPLLFRFHLVSSLHLYSRKFPAGSPASDPGCRTGEGASEERPIYIPPGGVHPVAGSDHANSSYLVSYPGLGRVQSAVLNLVHLAEPAHLFEALKHPENSRKNAAGSIGVGGLGGPGGCEVEYLHSHLVIRKPETGERIPFFEAFCR